MLEESIESDEEFEVFETSYMLFKMARREPTKRPVFG
jgi:hypothetical protein